MFRVLVAKEKPFQHPNGQTFAVGMPVSITDITDLSFPDGLEAVDLADVSGVWDKATKRYVPLAELPPSANETLRQAIIAKTPLALSEIEKQAAIDLLKKVRF